MLYIIGGVSRSGKSLLAHKILKEKLIPFFPLDGLIGMLTHSAPEHGVRHQNDFVDKSEKTWKFSKELFKYLFKTQELYLVEGDCILPKQIAELQVDYPQEIKSCFMGYTTLTAKQKLDLVRMYNKGEEDWTNKHDDEAMLEMIEAMIVYSKYLKGECEKYNIPFFDVSENFEKVQDEAYEFLIG
jgi:hypothetical protein